MTDVTIVLSTSILVFTEICQIYHRRLIHFHVSRGLPTENQGPAPSKAVAMYKVVLVLSLPIGKVEASCSYVSGQSS